MQKNARITYTIYIMHNLSVDLMDHAKYFDNVTRVIPARDRSFSPIDPDRKTGCKDREIPQDYQCK